LITGISERISMQLRVGDCLVELVLGDVSLQSTDAIVNAANSQLAGGGGVDGAIHRSGGPSILNETSTKYPDGCPTGEAVISSAGELKARYVVHAVGPVWRGGQHDEEELLGRAYLNSLKLALEYDCESVAFPSLSTGAYRYPIDLACRTALDVVLTFVADQQRPKLVRFVLFDPGSMGAYSAALEEFEIEGS
jgi:O-acetyl-ADP-ribose deacetylase (regulator of RNase III)